MTPSAVDLPGDYSLPLEKIWKLSPTHTPDPSRLGGGVIKSSKEASVYYNRSQNG